MLQHNQQIDWNFLRWSEHNLEDVNYLTTQLHHQNSQNGGWKRTGIASGRSCCVVEIACGVGGTVLQRPTIKAGSHPIMAHLTNATEPRPSGRMVLNLGQGSKELQYYPKGKKRKNKKKVKTETRRSWREWHRFCKCIDTTQFRTSHRQRFTATWLFYQLGHCGCLL
jgi:hypothetical protein